MSSASMPASMSTTQPFVRRFPAFAVALLLMPRSFDGRDPRHPQLPADVPPPLDASDEVFARIGRDVLLVLAHRGSGAVAGRRPRGAIDRRCTLAGGAPAARTGVRGGAAPQCGDDGRLCRRRRGAFFLVRSASDTRVRAAAARAGVHGLHRAERRGGVGPPRCNVPLPSRRSHGDRRRDAADFAFDPRTRDWYRAAMRSDRQIRTDPYVFFTTREPGITLAARIAVAPRGDRRGRHARRARCVAAQPEGRRAPTSSTC